MAKRELTEAEMARRQETVRKARKAAKAAGKRWKDLSREERKAFRIQVRGEK